MLLWMVLVLTSRAAVVSDVNVRDLCRAGVTRPSVEIRFEDLCAEASIPEVITKGIYTVGKDVMFKVLVSAHMCTACVCVVGLCGGWNVS